MNRNSSYFLCIRYLVLLCTLLVCSNLFSQYKEYKVIHYKADSADDNHIPVALLEKKPQFRKGAGLNEFTKWVYDEMVYPDVCKAKGIQGRVMVSFIITEEGDVTGVRVLRGVHPSLDAEAVRIVKSSPKWESPGADANGNVKSTRVVFPFIFQLVDRDKYRALKENPASDDTVLPATPLSLSKMPEFEGGDNNSFLRWIYSKITYPVQCLENNIGGRVIVSFIIGKDGKLFNPRVLRSSGNRFLDSASLNVVASSPKWKAGEKNGVPVKSRVVIPIVFQPVKDLFQNREDGDVMYTQQGTLIPPKFTEGSSSVIYSPNTHNNFTIWVFNNVEYPEEAKKQKLEGRVIVSFVVNDKGKVTNVNLVKSCNKVLDDEALKVIKSSPDWIPARINGVAVPVTYTFPLVFTLR